MKIKSIYVIGALANSEIPHFGNKIRELEIEAFDQWWAPGRFADSHWKNYAKIRGFSFKEALQDYAATHVFEFDKSHLERCDAAVMLMPAGKSGHLEFGYVIGRGKPGFIVFNEEPTRYDVMYSFATKIFFSKQEFFKYLRENN